MNQSPPRRLTYANITATLALAVALSTGGAYAADKIGSKDIAKNAVKSKHIAKGAVKAADIKDGSVTASELAPRKTAGVALAGASFFGGDAVVRTAFNRIGGPVSVSRLSPGAYNVTVPGATFDTLAAINASLEGGYNTYCYLNDIPAVSTIQVKCRTLDNVEQDSYVRFLLYADAA